MRTSFNFVAEKQAGMKFRALFKCLCGSSQKKNIKNLRVTENMQNVREEFHEAYKMPPPKLFFHETIR